MTHTSKTAKELSYRIDDRAMRPVMGALKIFESAWLRPRLLFPNFSFVPIDPMNVHAKFEVRTLPVPEIILGGT